MLGFGAIVLALPTMLVGATMAWGIGGGIFVLGGYLLAAGVFMGTIRQ